MMLMLYAGGWAFLEQLQLNTQELHMKHMPLLFLMKLYVATGEELHLLDCPWTNNCLRNYAGVMCMSTAKDIAYTHTNIHVCIYNLWLYIMCIMHVFLYYS